MCFLVSTGLDRDTDESPSARPKQRTDSTLTVVLRTFFEKRLQAETGRSAQVRLLVRRTLARLARRRTSASSGDSDRLQKVDVLRAALMELQECEAPAVPHTNDRPPVARRN
jgi:CRP-like cAMP-binding protein